MPRVASKSAFVAPSFTAIATPWMTSPASGPIMCAPTTRCEARWTISFMRVRSLFSVSVSLRARNEVLYTSIAPWALRAASSDRPTLARFGLAKTAVGTLAWSTGVGELRNSVLASHIASAVATGVVDPVGDISDGVNRVYRAPGVFIHHYRAVGGQFHTRGLQAEVPGDRPAPGREHHQAVVLDAVVAEQDLDLRAELHQVHGVHVEPHVDPLAGHLLAEALADLGVEAAQQPAAAVRERGGHSHAVEDRGELHRDVPAADHQRARGQLLEVEGLVRRDGELGSGDLRQARPGAGRHQDVPGGAGAAVHLDFIGPLDDGTAADDFHSRTGQGALVEAVEALDLAVLVREQPGPVEARRAGVPAVGLCDLEILAEMRRVREQLLGDAADVDAGAAEAAGLGDRHARAVAGGHAARADPARAAADGEQIVIEAQLTSGSGGSAPRAPVAMLASRGGFYQRVARGVGAHRAVGDQLVEVRREGARRHAVDARRHVVVNQGQQLFDGSPPELLQRGEHLALARQAMRDQAPHFLVRLAYQVAVPGDRK